MTLVNHDTVFTYTDEYYPASSLIDSVYYDANTREALLDVDNALYLYSNVEPNDIQALLEGDENGSVGAYYNRNWKGRFPSRYVGQWNEVEYQSTEKIPSVNVNPAEVVSVPRTGPTKEYSLQPLPNRSSVVVADVESASAEVEFTLDGIDNKTFHYSSNTSDVYEAVEELHEYIARIGTTGKVKKVVVNFG